MAPAMALAQWALVFVRLAAAESAADFVDQLLERMTLEEKAGQLGVFARPGGSDFNPGSHTKDWNETLQKVRAGQVSAFFNGEGVKVNRELQRVAVEESRLGIPLIFGADIWHGMWTIFPIPLAEAASFEPELARRTARATAVEATRAGLMWTFAPMVDVSRDQRWGRTAEGAGEDPLLGARFARARVQGFQGPNLKAEDSLAACLKHFAGYGGVEAGLDYSQSDMSEATFRDVHLPPFIAGIEAGALTVMSAFIALMGVPATGNRWLLTKVLRQELGFNGFVVTDYEADKELVNHGFAADASDAARLSLTAGSDMSMQSGIYRDHLPDLTTRGTVPRATLDEAVRRVLHAKLSMGLFANPYRSLTLGRETLPAELVEQHDSLAREASRKSVVLLRNEHSLLPLKRGQRIGIVGWWGNDTADTDGVGVLWGNKSHSLSLLDGMTAAVDPSLLRFEPGSSLKDVDRVHTMPQYVVKRNGTQQEVKFDAITRRLRPLCEGLDGDYIDPVLVTQKVIEGFYNGIATAEIDTLAAETCAYMSQKHPDFSTLAARIAISNLHKNTSDSFCETCRVLYEYKDQQGRPATLLADDVYRFVVEHAAALDAAVDYKRDLGYDYFGFKTLEKSYLLRVHGKIVERPQHMIMRAACGIHCGDLSATLETYDLMSRKFFTHATPTLFNAGTPKPQMSSCFLLTMKDDSIEGIYDTLKQCAQISKSAGGIGVAISNVRASGAYIRGTNGKSNGLVPMLRNFNETARYVDQGGGKRKGSFAMYLEPWHADVFDFLELRKNHGKEEQRARDLFLGLWIPDLFMTRVKENKDWTLFCPNEAFDQETGKGLIDLWGADFERLYNRLEAEGKGRKTVKAQQLWFRILEAQMETGTPYMLYKDSCNRKSNQQNLGTIHCSNLCTEIVEYTSPDEVAVCNLASIALSAFAEAKTFDFQGLYMVTKVATKNLNKVIDRNYYPVPEARVSNLRHRPVGLGVQGLADALLLLKLPFESLEAKRLNEEIFETIYFAACEASCELAALSGPYETYAGSPASKGLLQFDLWGREPSKRWDWQALKQKIGVHGLRNSLLVAPMPTASTAQILGNNESFEPYTQNLYVRRVLSGEFVQVNRHLLKDLIARNLWTDQLRMQLIAHNGSVQRLDLPQDLKDLYKTVWEIKQKAVLDMAADRGAYIDQSQSLNIHMVDVTTAKLSSMHFHGWQLGLKTGLYYLRTKAAADAIKFTVEVDQLKASDSEGSTLSSSTKVTEVSEKATIEALKAEGPKYSCVNCSA